MKPQRVAQTELGDPICANCQRLRDELELLQEKYALMEKRVGVRCDHVIPGLTNAEIKIIDILMTRDIVRYESIMTLLYGDRVADRDIPDINILKVHISKMRPKLEIKGIEIETVWGIGYRLSSESKKRVTDILEGVQ